MTRPEKVAILQTRLAPLAQKKAMIDACISDCQTLLTNNANEAEWTALQNLYSAAIDELLAEMNWMDASIYNLNSIVEWDNAPGANP